jgi:hypothetical protein
MAHNTSDPGSPPLLSLAEAEVWMLQAAGEPGLSKKSVSFVDRFNNTDTSLWEDVEVPDFADPNETFDTKLDFLNELIEYSFGSYDRSQLPDLFRRMSISLPNDWDDPTATVEFP